MKIKFNLFSYDVNDTNQYLLFHEGGNAKRERGSYPPLFDIARPNNFAHTK